MDRLSKPRSAKSFFAVKPPKPKEPKKPKLPLAYIKAVHRCVWKRKNVAKNRWPLYSPHQDSHPVFSKHLGQSYGWAANMYAKIDSAGTRFNDEELQKRFNAKYNSVHKPT